MAQGPDRHPRRRKGAKHVDRIDLNILAALYASARLSKVQMSEAVGISAGRCHQRMQRLEADGIVRGYHADVDLGRLTGAVQFLTQITLRNDASDRVRQFERAAARTPEVLWCLSVLGQIDYIAVIAAPGIERYQEVIGELRQLSGDEFEFLTYAISGSVKAAGQADLRALVTRLGSAATAAATRHGT
ncbi:MAG: Lrp/AsnC family transcriptional regulator [Proteobacteria bacterium]|nr:Lrp/AsnC family transcriptional regulator [Pseudomonadota bacterium]